MLKNKKTINILALLIMIFGTLFYCTARNDFIFGTDVMAADLPPVENDMLYAPRYYTSAMGGPGEALGAGFYDTSEYMVGKVSIAAILVESNGLSDPSTENWNSTREVEVKSEIQAGMQFWQDVKDSKTELTFQYHFINGRTDSKAQTKYEPINRISWTGSGGQDIWIAEIMSKMGYGSGDYFDRVRAYLNDLIKQDKSDWGYVMFIVDSKNDPDGRFSDSKFAYAYYGGPFLVMTYDNDGYGINNMDAIAAHESGHIFFALDQYYAASEPCTRSVGYLNIKNLNSLYGTGCETDDGSIMRGGVDPFQTRLIDKYAKGQIGWWDLDSDGYVDVVDTYPNTTINSYSGQTSDQTPTLTGTAKVYALENKNPYYSSKREGDSFDISINEVKAVQYRVDGGAWIPAVASDGSFNEPQEDYTITTSKLDFGLHNIEVRAKNNLGFWETSPASTTVILGDRRIITGAGFSGGPHVRMFDQLGNVINSGFFAYAENVRNGVKVAACDLDGNGIDEIVTGTGNGSGPHVRIFKKDGSALNPGFFAYGEGFRGGVGVACGDLNGDGKDEIITGAGVGGGPQVRVFDGEGNLEWTPGFFAFDPSFRGGVNVAVGDIDGDGDDEIIAGAGTGGGPHIRMFERDGKLMANSFFAFHPDSRTGIDVAAGDFDGDGKDDVVATQIANGEAWTKVYKYNNEKTVLGSFRAFEQGEEYGGYVSALDVDYDGLAEIIIGQGYGGDSEVRIYEKDGTQNLMGFYPYGVGFRGGAYVTVGEF